MLTTLVSTVRGMKGPIDHQNCWLTSDTNPRSGATGLLCKEHAVEDGNGGALTPRGRVFPAGAVDLDTAARPQILPCEGGLMPENDAQALAENFASKDVLVTR